MIKIGHINGDVKFVTQGAYDSFFKPLGYKPIVEEQVKEEKKELTGEKEKVEKPVEEKKVEKPIEEPKSFGNKEIKDKRK